MLYNENLNQKIHLIFVGRYTVLHNFTPIIYSLVYYSSDYCNFALSGFFLKRLHAANLYTNRSLFYDGTPVIK